MIFADPLTILDYLHHVGQRPQLTRHARRHRRGNAQALVVSD